MIRRRVFLAVLLLGLSVGALQTGAQVWGQAAPSPGTHVCGTVSSDTVWTRSNAPYVMDCTVVLATGATLTIEPGVSVVGSSAAQLSIGGRLLADGTADAPISFTWTDCCKAETGIAFASFAPPTSSLAYVEISGATTGIRGYPGPLLSHLYVHDIGNYGLDLTLPELAELTIEDSVFARNPLAVAASVGDGSLTIRNSTLTASTRPDVSTIYLRDVRSNDVHITGNSIVDNASTWDIELYGSSAAAAPTVDAANNWWGTTDASAIAGRIGDCKQESTEPCVTFQPFLQAPNAAASLPPTPTPTPTLTPTPTPTSTPTPAPTLAIRRVQILHRVGSSWQTTGPLTAREHVDFQMFYQPIQPSIHPKGAVTVTKSGKSIMHMSLHTFRSGGAVGLHKIVSLTPSATGHLVAHFSLQLGATTVRRDRVFDVRR